MKRLGPCWHSPKTGDFLESSQGVSFSCSVSVSVLARNELTEGQSPLRAPEVCEVSEEFAVSSVSMFLMFPMLEKS